MTPKNPTDRVNVRVIGICIAAALGGFLFGFDTAVINGAVDAIRERFALERRAAPASSWPRHCSAAPRVPWFAGTLADRCGRVRGHGDRRRRAASLVLRSARGWPSASWDLTALARRSAASASAAASVIAPAYIAEVSPARRSAAALGSLQQLAIVTGIFVALLVRCALRQRRRRRRQPLWLGLEAWRWMFLVGGRAGAWSTASCRFTPAGVAALPGRQRRRIDRGARRSCTARTGGRPDVTPARSSRSRPSCDGTRATSLRDLRGPGFGLRPIVWIGILLSVFQQFVGINVIFYYSTTLWQLGRASARPTR